MSDRGLAHLVLTRRGYAAITLGHVLVFAREPTDALWTHEIRHVKQYERLGLAFLPLYLRLYAKHGYAGHPLERDAAGVVALWDEPDHRDVATSEGGDKVRDEEPQPAEGDRQPDVDA